MKSKSFFKILMFLLLFIFLFSNCFSANYVIDVGVHIEDIPAPIKKGKDLAFLFIGMILETWEVKLGEVLFKFAFDSKREIIYIQNDSSRFRTPENLGMNSSMAALLTHSDEGIRVIPGIAYYIPLRSGWNVEIGDIFQDIHKIKNQEASPRFFFKRHEKLSRSIAFKDYISYTKKSDIIPILKQKGNRKVFYQDNNDNP